MAIRMSEEGMVIVGIEDAERCDFIVCMPYAEPLMLPDNVRDTCKLCGCKVQLRPYPHAPKRPMRVCLDCAHALAQRDRMQ